MTPALRHQLDRLVLRLHELQTLLSEPNVASDRTRWRQLTREQAQTAERVELYQRYQRTERDLLDAAALRAEPEWADLAEQEIDRALAEQADLRVQLQHALLPRDPDDERPAFVEIRAGAGGDEAALFAGELARMYLRHAEQQGWRCETLSSHPAELGGYKEWVARIEGDGVYGRLKYESGGHRVQRIPATESQGRIHTSACTVAVLPEPDEAQEVTLNPAELRIDTFRASGAGGQHVNKTDSAIRVTHLPTGLVAECQDDRSQHRNKARALAVLTARLRERERHARAAQEAATRKSLVGSGDRSDRIRTYNFPQGRLTDHRIHLTLHKLTAILDGALDEVIDALHAAECAAQLAELETPS